MITAKSDDVLKRTTGLGETARQAVSLVCVVSVFVFTSGALMAQYLPQYPGTQQYPAPSQYPQYPQYPAAQYPAPQQYPPATQYPAPQQTYPAQPAPTGQQPLLTPAQLDNLIAPIALYPDPLLGQILAASTYPLEVVEVGQWLQQHGNLHGADLMNAARQQNWDPSVQALVAFPDVVAMLNRDIQWTTDLGNAFLAQQNDVMAAVQTMRVRAQQNGRLSSNGQQTVTTQTQNGQSAVVIEPTQPQTVYVPVYDPDYIWGPPAYGYYPPLWYPPISYGFGFGPGIYLGGFFPGWIGFGWGGFGLGWGWGLGWFGAGLGLFVNSLFFGHFGLHGFYGGGFGGGRYAWAHDPYHRAGVGYANRAVAARYNNARFAAGRAAGGSARSYAANSARSFAGNAGRSYAGNAARSYAGNSARSYAGNTARSYAGNARGYSGGYSGAGRSYSSTQRYGGYTGSSRSYSGSSRGSSSAGRSFGGGGGHSSGGGHSGGGHGGRR